MKQKEGKVNIMYLSNLRQVFQILIVQNTLKNVRAAGVAIYQRSNISHVSTTNIDLMVQNATEINVSQAPVGDLCASQILMDDGREFLMVIVYISPNQKINDIIAFLHR